MAVSTIILWTCFYMLLLLPDHITYQIKIATEMERSLNCLLLASVVLYL